MPIINGKRFCGKTSESLKDGYLSAIISNEDGKCPIGYTPCDLGPKPDAYKHPRFSISYKVMVKSILRNRRYRTSAY